MPALLLNKRTVLSETASVDACLHCVQGRRVSSESWYDIGLMSTQPLFQRTEVEGASGRLTAQLTMSTAFQGGSCLQLMGVCWCSKCFDVNWSKCV